MLILIFAMGVTSAGCVVSPGGSDAPDEMDEMQTDDPSDGDGDLPDGDGGDSGNDAGGATFGSISGNEILFEGVSFDQGDGGFRRSEEHFTSTFSLEPVSAELGQVFVGDALVDIIRGDLQGSAQLTYAQSSHDFTPELDCPTALSEGNVAWEVTLHGTYSHIPAIGSLTVLVFAETVSSPEYNVSYTSSGCPEFDSTSPSSYAWPGPAAGNPVATSIVLQDGTFTFRLENVTGDDLGDDDYYEIHVESAGL